MMQIHPELFSECDDPAPNQIDSSIVCAAVTWVWSMNQILLSDAFQFSADSKNPTDVSVGLALHLS